MAGIHPLRFFRKYRKLSQEELGNALGVTKQMVSSWENDRVKIDIKHFENLKKALQISDVELMCIVNDEILGGFLVNNHFIHAPETLETYNAIQEFDRNNPTMDLNTKMTHIKQIIADMASKEKQEIIEGKPSSFTHIPPPKDDNIKNISIVNGSSSTKEKQNPSDAEFIPAKTPMKKFPVISDAAAAECNTSYMPIAEYATMHAEEEISFSEGQDGDFVIRVTGNSMLPWYPEGTLILVRPYQTLKNGDRVVAILEDGSVTFKCFAEKNDKFYLLSINERDGQDFAFEKSNHSAIRAIYQVIQSMRDERAMDRAMKNAGLHHFWERKLRELE